MGNDSLIDLDHLEKYVGDDSALRDEILTIFADQADILAEQLDVRQGDDEWRDTAHALKGAARGVGAWALGDLCEEAERMKGVMRDKLENRAALLERLRLQLAQTVQQARQLRDEYA